MIENETPRSIRFPQKLWDAIDRDAKRCKRSAVKQMEAVLSAYYRINDSNIDIDRLNEIQVIEPQSRLKDLQMTPNEKIKKAG